MKYVMIKNKKLNQLVPVIFPSFMVHSVVAQAISQMLKNHHHADPEIVSAGDISCIVRCSGNSETLGVSSDPIDEHVINTIDYMHGLIYD